MVMGCGPRGGEWAGFGGRKERKEREEKTRFENNNIII